MSIKVLNSNQVDDIVLAFEHEKVITIPTDTVFGMACIYDSKQAIERIKQIKHRDRQKPLPMMCNGLEMIEEYAEVKKEYRKIISYFKKGAITYILNIKKIPDYVNDGRNTIAIRVPDDDLLIEIITRLNKPILMTSANMSNEPNIKSYQEVYDKFADKVDILVKEDAKSEMASTIVDLTGQEIKILREGIITKEMIQSVM